MSAIRRALVVVIIASGCGSVSGCEREQRRFKEGPPAAATARGIGMSDVGAGGQPASPSQRSPYMENAWAISEGKRLFTAFNCTGCHAHGGGGSGPALMDRKWIYGSEPANIHQTIVEGRPNGMPRFGGVLREQQVWQLTAYVRSLSGLVPKDAASGRDDHMQVKPQEQSLPEMQPPVLSGSPP